MTQLVFFTGKLDPTHNSTDPEPFFKTFFFGKKIIKLKQYWFNCLLWGLRKQLRHLYNYMQIN